MMLFLILLVALSTLADDAKKQTELVNAVKSCNQLGSVVQGVGVTKSTCEPALPPLTKMSADLATFLTKVSCTDLFSEKPPKFFKKAYTPLDPFVEKNWKPLCSLRTFHEDERILVATPAFEQTVAQVQKNWIWGENNRDLCVLPEQSLRFNAAYVSSSVKSRNVLPATQAQRDLIMKQIDSKGGIRERTKALCCSDGDKDCIKYLDLVKVDFCKTLFDLEDPKFKALSEAERDKLMNSPEPCTDQGTFFNLSTDEWKTLNDDINGVKSASMLKGKIHFQAGMIQTGNLVAVDGSSIDGPGTLEHEFGHACSTIRRQIAINQGDQYAYRDWILNNNSRDSSGHPAEGCKASYSMENTFSLVWKSIQGPKLGKDVAECFEAVAKTGDKTKFISPQRDCTNGCPRSHMEESFADWMKFETSLDMPYAFNAIMGLCYYQRDDLHSLGSDNLRCALKSGTFLKK